MMPTVTATSGTVTTSLDVSVCLAPANTGRPAITGSAEAGRC